MNSQCLYKLHMLQELTAIYGIFTGIDGMNFQLPIFTGIEIQLLNAIYGIFTGIVNSPCL